MKKFFEFIEEDYVGNTTSFIFPMECNTGAYKLLHKAFPNMYESNYHLEVFETECKKNEFINYNALNLNKDIRIINGMINTNKLKKYIKALNDGDDFFENHGILNLVAYFITPDMIF